MLSAAENINRMFKEITQFHWHGPAGPGPIRLRPGAAGGLCRAYRAYNFDSKFINIHNEVL